MLCFVLWVLCCNFLSIKIYVCTWVDLLFVNNNFTLKYIIQPKLSSKQMKWQNTLALFNVNIQHTPRKNIVVPNMLSQKHQLKVVYVGEIDLRKEVWLTSHCDEFAKEIKQNIQNGINSHFHLWDGLLWYKQNWLYVPKRKLRVLLKECHDGPLVAHGGAKCPRTFFWKTYYWLNLKDDVEEYVKTCLTC
jgi:hypothetical protein